MKIINYNYDLIIRGIKEPIILSKIDAENLIMKLTENDNRFIVFSLGQNEKKAVYTINRADIVGIIPNENWYNSRDEIELTLEEERVHQNYQIKVEGKNNKMLN
jgi:hypothetical protein